MDQYTNYLDALSQPIYSQQANASTFLSPESCPPSLSASPVSSEASDFIDEVMRYGLFGYDHSPATAYGPYSENSMNNFVTGSTPMNDCCSPSVIVKHEDSFSYDHHMMFDRGIAPTLSTYHPVIGYAPQEHGSMAFQYPVHPNTVSSLANMLADSAPFATVAPSDTSDLPDEDASAYHLSAEIAELSISSPVSSPLFHAGSLGSSPSLLPMSQPQPSPVCDPKALSSPIIVEQPITQAGPAAEAEGSRRSRAPSYRISTVDSDYSPSGESEVEDENDHSYEEPPNRKKTRSARVSHTAHPYLKPAPKAKGNKRRSTKIEIPIPVPGLTKNSRGRSVPKKSEALIEDGSRPFWCSVEDCNKMFSRGEHLKRHIQSIHTQVKPFRCQCDNIFNRQDNLFQHMRARGCTVWYNEAVPQRELKDDATKAREEAEAEDRYIEQIMADAKIAQNKRDRVRKQPRSRS